MVISFARVQHCSSFASAACVCVWERDSQPLTKQRRSIRVYIPVRWVWTSRATTVIAGLRTVTANKKTQQQQPPIVTIHSKLAPAIAVCVFLCVSTCGQKSHKHVQFDAVPYATTTNTTHYNVNVPPCQSNNNNNNKSCYDDFATQRKCCSVVCCHCDWPVYSIVSMRR